MLNHNYPFYIFVFAGTSSYEAKSACQPQGWRTVSDFASAKVINIKQLTKQINRKHEI